jgi:hypothetical protein
MADIEIKYTFDTYEDKNAVTVLIKHYDYYMALQEIKDFIREQLKYSNKENISLEELKSKFYEIINAYNIDLDL